MLKQLLIKSQNYEQWHSSLTSILPQPTNWKYWVDKNEKTHLFQIITTQETECFNIEIPISLLRLFPTHQKRWQHKEVFLSKFCANIIHNLLEFNLTFSLDLTNYYLLATTHNLTQQTTQVRLLSCLGIHKTPICSKTTKYSLMQKK